jgi:hypothetical protein
MRSRKTLAVLVLAAVGALVFAVPAIAATVVTLEASLTGEKEVPGPGDRNGTGDAKIILKPAKQKVCYVLRADDIRPAQAAHIHEGRRNVAGPVVVELKPPTNGFSSGCTTASRALIRDMIQTPAEYYVNVHNAPFPAGAIRGQLSR